MERKQPMLHEAMRTILMKCKDHTATYLEISKENRRLDLFRRPKDGKFPDAHQVRGRAGQYEDWFKRLGGGVVQFIGPVVDFD